MDNNTVLCIIIVVCTVLICLMMMSPQPMMPMRECMNNISPTVALHTDLSNAYNAIRNGIAVINNPKLPKEILLRNNLISIQNQLNTMLSEINISRPMPKPISAAPVATPAPVYKPPQTAAEIEAARLKMLFERK